MTQLTTGRPTKYTQELASILCAKLTMGISLRTVCKDDQLPCISTVYNWFKSVDGFVEQYTRAKEESADALVEDMLDIADNQVDQPLIIDGEPVIIDGKCVMVKDAVAVNHARLRVDTRKWAASKLKPKKYGDRTAVEHTGADGGAIDMKWTVEIIEPAENTPKLLKNDV